MAFTRFHDDPCRIVKQNQQMTDQGRWILNVPGNGDKPCYMMDPQIIPQKWAGNLWTNCIDVQSSLRGLDRPLTRDCLGKNNYEPTIKKINTYPIQYPTCETLTTEQSRVTDPAWTFRDLEQVDWYYLPMDPQENVFMPFQHNLNTRVLEKDYFLREADCQRFQPLNFNTIQSQNTYPSQPEPGRYVAGPNVCTTSDSCENPKNL
jgi:hypothetical protein